MAALKSSLHRSLARQITVLVAVLLFIVGLAVSLVSYIQVLRLTRQVASDRLRVLVSQLAPLLGRGPGETLIRLSRAASHPAVVAFVRSNAADGRAAAIQALNATFQTTPTSATAVTDRSGTVLLDLGPPQRQAWFGPPPQRLGALPSDTVGSVGPFYRLDDTTLITDLRVPIRESGRTIGLLVNRGRVIMSSNSRSTFDVLLGEGTSLMIGSPVNGVWTDMAGVMQAPPEEALQMSTVNRFRWKGVENLGAAAFVPGTPWLVLVRTPFASVAKPARAYLRTAVVMAIAVVLLGALAALTLGRRLGRPIREITKVAEQVVSGEEIGRADEESPGEVGSLARSFNAMVDRLAHSTRQLRDNEASHRAFVTHASAGIWRVEFVPALSTQLAPQIQIDTWYRVVPFAECNAAMARMLGVEAAESTEKLPLEMLFPHGDPACRELLAGFVAAGYRCIGAETRIAAEGVGSGPRVFVNDLIGIVENGVLRRIWGIRRDVTMERLLDDRLAQTQRLEAVGRLAGGVAHDFNNILTAILGYTDSLRERLPAADGGREDAAEVQRLALRASELTRHLLAFSRGQVLRPTALDLNEVVAGMDGLLRRVIGEDVELKLQLAERIEPIEADAGQIERVMMNLVVNARDAMPEGGVLEIRTANVDLDAEYASLRPGVRPGRYVMLAVSDNGEGMTEEVRRHIFEPFFTTKPKGRGTGLGLATVYGIVRQSGGDVSVYSEEGRGATIKVYLPVRGRPAVPAEPSVPSPLAAEPARLTGTETVLLVEDEEPVRRVVKRALSASGYRVLEAGDGAEAIRQWEGHASPIDLVITDMVLPGMTGRELAFELLRRRHDARVIIMSGYTGETYPALEVLPSGVGYLEKPFSLADLRLRIREVLDGSPDGAPAAS
jgi:signal transduction histidine kinase/ActR/RegA family two-component response regulator